MIGLTGTAAASVSFIGNFRPCLRYSRTGLVLTWGQHSRFSKRWTNKYAEANNQQKSVKRSVHTPRYYTKATTERKQRFSTPALQHPNVSISRHFACFADAIFACK
jgi:hypothetical protein